MQKCERRRRHWSGSGDKADVHRALVCFCRQARQGKATDEKEEEEDQTVIWIKQRGPEIGGGRIKQMRKQEKDKRGTCVQGGGRE